MSAPPAVVVVWLVVGGAIVGGFAYAVWLAVDTWKWKP